MLNIYGKQDLIKENKEEPLFKNQKANRYDMVKFRFYTIYQLRFFTDYGKKLEDKRLSGMKYNFSNVFILTKELV